MYIILFLNYHLLIYENYNGNCEERTEEKIQLSISKHFIIIFIYCLKINSKKWKTKSSKYSI